MPKLSKSKTNQAKKGGLKSSRSSNRPMTSVPIAYTPKVPRTSLHGLTIKHRELVSVIDVVNITEGKLYSIIINPGLRNSFPWLSMLSHAFDKYRFRSLRYTYVGYCATTLTGQICMAIDYDSIDPPPDSMGALMSMEGAETTAPWKEVSLSLDLSRLDPPTRYVEHSENSSMADPRLNNVGTLQIRSAGPTTTYSCGALYVDYEIELLIPQPETVENQVIKYSTKVGNTCLVDPLTVQKIAGNLVQLASPDATVTRMYFKQVGNYLLNMIGNPNVAGSGATYPYSVAGTGTTRTGVVAKSGTDTLKSSSTDQVRVTNQAVVNPEDGVTYPGYLDVKWALNTTNVVADNSIILSLLDNKVALWS